MAKFTDRQLVDLYAGLVGDYQAYRTANWPHDSIVTELENKVANTIEPPRVASYSLDRDNTNTNALNKLDKAEKSKIMRAASVIIEACKPSQATAQQVGSTNMFGQSSNSSRSAPKLSIHYCCSCNFCSPYRTSALDWYLIGRLSSGPQLSAPPLASQYNAGNLNRDWSELAFVLIAIAAVSAALLSAYYLYQEMVNSVARFYYNEGWTQAALSYLSIAASAVVAGMISTMFAAPMLLELAMGAGFVNPILASAIVIGALTVTGAALGCMAFNELQDYLITNSSADALDPDDPARFALTDSDVNAWTNKNIDPVKVKCAIVALRAEMGKFPVSTISTLFSPQTTVDTKKRCLNLVRELRAGQHETLKVGKMTFDFRSMPKLGLKPDNHSDSNYPESVSDFAYVNTTYPGVNNLQQYVGDVVHATPLEGPSAPEMVSGFKN